MKYVLSLDQGTTSSRAVLVDEQQRVVAAANREFAQIYPKEGWVEHDPDEIYFSQLAAVKEVFSKSGVSMEDVAAIGVTNQRETTVVWEKSTGRPVYNAIVWQCRRTAPTIEALLKSGCKEEIVRRTGLVPDAYFSASKIKWILNNVSGARAQAERGELLFGTVDTWLIWKLTGGKVHATDVTNASRTMLFNIDTLSWDKELLKLFEIPEGMLPKVLSSGEFYGEGELFGKKFPITGVAGDQQAALFGRGCFQKGQAKNTYGTGCFLLMHTGHERTYSQNGLLTTLAATLKGERAEYALEGSVFVGGALVQWLRDEMRFFENSRDVEAYARKVEDTGGVYIVPAFTGLGAPYWDMYARGGIFGLTRGTKREHIIRAAEEAIAYQSAELAFAMEKDAGAASDFLKADGGASRDGFLMQFQADILHKKVLCSASHESTALGAASLAGLSIGLWKNREQLDSLREEERVYLPDMDESIRAEKLKNWRRAVERTRGWIEP